MTAITKNIIAAVVHQLLKMPFLSASEYVIVVVRTILKKGTPLSVAVC